MTHPFSQENFVRKIDSKAAKWVASDAIRELGSEAVQKRLGI